MATQMIDARACLAAASVRNTAPYYIEATERLNLDLEQGARAEAAELQAPISSYTVPIIRDEDELVRKAEIWLSAQGRMDAIEAGLQRPYTVLPLPNVPITPKQVLDTWAHIRHDKEIHTWKSGSTLSMRFPDRFGDVQNIDGKEGQLKFLEHWPHNALSGFDESAREELENYTLNPDRPLYFDTVLDRAVRFVAIEIGGEDLRLGTGSEELVALRGLQQAHPTIRSASLFETGVLNMKHRRSPPFDYPTGFNATFARAVELEELVGEFEDLPTAFVSGSGFVQLGGLSNLQTAPLRRAVA